MAASAFVAQMCDSLQSIMKCDVYICKCLYANGVPFDGTTQLAGIGVRMTKELTSMPPSTNKVDDGASPERTYSVSIGGSILSSFLRISKNEYHKSRPAVDQQKCF